MLLAKICIMNSPADAVMSGSGPMVNKMTLKFFPRQRDRFHTACPSLDGTGYLYLTG